MKVAVLDDYQRVALRLADWSAVQARCTVDVFDRNLKVPDEAASALAPYDIICLLRERMPVPSALIERLPNLKFIAVTGTQNRTLDLAAATRRGIVVSHTSTRGAGFHATPELTWGLILAAVRHLTFEDRAMRGGAWQTTVGTTLHGKTLGILGLGKIGRRVAEFGKVFGMNVVAWSPSLTADIASTVGVTRVEKDELLRVSDVVTIHVVLNERSRGMIGARDLALLKPTAWLVNTSRGPLIDGAALLEALRARRIAGAALDVYDEEPLPTAHPLRGLDNVVLSPHLGFVAEETYRVFFEDIVEAIGAFLDGRPIRLLNPLERAIKP
jgi:phosphoglycerate dehydrogenase-like enzyme